jgi:2-oxoisovalerate dehydrogenase E2 component (dihydrolipoyl transacylase)
MAHEVKMPQLGESVFEGTIGKWLKREGEAVEKYEPLLEVITDKVDTEVTAVESGTLLSILVPEGETVKVGTVLALIGAAGEVGANGATAGAAPAAAPEPQAPAIEPATAAPTLEPAIAEATPESEEPAPRVTPVAARVAAEHGVDPGDVSGTGPGGQVRRKDVERHVLDNVAAAAAPMPTPSAEAADTDMSTFISPRVARLAMQLDVDLRQVRGTGEGDRVTARDVEAYAAAQPAAASTQAAPAPTTAPAPSTPTPTPAPATTPRAGTVLAGPTVGDLLELTPMRRAIADHMVRSKATSPHVTTVHEVDMSAVVATREALKAQYAERGISLTYTAFIMHALAQALVEHPMVNSSWTDAGVRLHRDVNIGLAVAIPQGLIVPVVRGADQKSLMGLAHDINDLATRARNKQLLPDDVQGGTFTMTNYGTLGSLFGTPVINQPQAAILGTGAIVKRVVVVEAPGGDTIAIRPMMFLALTFDHRILDGGSADPFLRNIVDRLQGYTA